MATFLFDSNMFGPVISRRTGVSPGINLLPVNRKVCSFNCIYTDYGWTPGKPAGKEPLPSRKEVYAALRKKMSEMKAEAKAPDVITYAGNGQTVDNTTQKEISAWFSAHEKLQPQQVMIYTIHRDTPLGSKMHKVPVAEINAIARRVNKLSFATSLSG